MTQQSKKLQLHPKSATFIISSQSTVTTKNACTGQPQNLNSQNYLSLLVTSEDASANNLVFAQKQPLTSNILPTTITKDKFLAAIFPFKCEETTAMLLFSEAALEAKPITTIYTDAKVEGQSIKLILDSGSAGNIITRQLMDQLGHQVDQAANTRIITANKATKTPIGKIDDFPFKVNGITDANHNELPPILSWDDKRKKKEEELTWKPNLGA
ncbi:hypothetical protein G9A89_014975 [Geosiphon pyriformis]|nr:hypothetical protein G9A89_014975 [Geosiphon pyriformis]